MPRVILLGVALQLFGILGAARCFADSHTWLFTNSTEGWTGSSGTSVTATGGSNLHVVFTTGGGIFSNDNVGFTAAHVTNQHDYIRFGYRVTSGNIAQLKFNFETTTRVDYSSPDYYMPVSNDGNFHWITYPIDQISGWRNSTIRRLRFVAIASNFGGASGTLDLDYCFLRLDDSGPYAPTITTDAMGDWVNHDVAVSFSDDDPPPNGFPNPVGPDVYGSGVYDFFWHITNAGYTGADTQRLPDTFNPASGVTTSTVTIPASSMRAGSNAFHIYAFDKVGLAGPDEHSFLVKYDPNPPGTPALPVASPAQWTNVSAFHLTWNNPGDDLSGVDHFDWVVDDVPDGTTTDAFADVGVTGAGDHRFQVRAVDAAGNPGALSGTVHLLFDDGPPSAPGAPTATPPGYTNVNSFAFNWGGSSDGLSGLSRYQYRIDSGSITDVTAPSVAGVSAVAPGARLFEVRAVDVAGNASDWVSTTFFYWPNYLFPPALQSPVDGQSVALAETFSWAAVPRAAGYEIQVAPQGTFDGPLWSTTTTSLTSVVVPASAAAVTGSSYGWRVRALGSDPPSPWAATRSFIRVTGVLPPAAPVLLAPATGASFGGPDAVFQWSPVTGAASYRLEVSSDPAFGAGAASNWSESGLTTTSKVVSFSDLALDLYWRVSASNSAGVGGTSATRDLHLQTPQPGLSAATIISPSLDVTVDQGQGMLATGLITGRATGNAVVEWLLDGEPYSSETIVLTGQGCETSPAPIPTAVLGPHSLQLRVTAGNQVFSPLRAVDVVTPGFGAPTQLVLVADQPQLLTGEATNLYATVRDDDGAIVLTDNGRHLHFEPTDGGAVSPPDADALGGVALTSFTAPGNEAQPMVVVSELAGKPGARPNTGSLPGSTAQMGVSNTELRRQQQIAYDYLKRLGGLNWNGIPGVAGTNSPGSFSIGPTLNFVNHTHIGDEARLRRLNLFLRLIDRSFFYDPRVNGYGTREAGAIWGAATLHADEVNSIGKILLSLVALVDKLDQSSSKLGWLQKVQAGLQKLAMKWIVEGLDLVVRHAIDWSNISNTEKVAAHGWWDRCKTLSRESVGYGHSESILGIIADATFVVTMTKWSVDNGYTKQVQPILDQVLGTISHPSWSGGSDTRATQAVDGALAEIRTKTARQHSKYVATMASFDRLRFFNDVQSLASAFGWWAFVNNVFNRSIQNLIIWATGFDCGTIAGRIPAFIALKANDIIAYQSPSAAPVWQASRLESLRPAVAPAPREALVMNPSITAAFTQANDGVTAFESAARDLEVALLASDAVGAETAFEALASLDSGLADDDQRVAAPLLSAVEQGRLEIGGMMAEGDVLALGTQQTVRGRIQALGTTADWLAAPTDDALRQAALDSLRAALEISHGGVEGFVSYAPKILGTEAVPYLVLDSPAVPAAIVLGQDAAIEITVRNLGAGTAHAVSLVMSGPGAFASFPAGDRRSIGDLAAGESRIARWQVHATPSLADTDSASTVFFSVHNDGGDALGGGRSVGLLVSRTGANVDVPRSDPGIAEFAVYPPRPNPARGAVSIEYALPSRADVTVDILDLSGRRVARIARRDDASGVHRVEWNSRDGSGMHAPAGTYFVRVHSRLGTKFQRVTILR